MDVNCCEKANNYVKEEEEEDIETLKDKIKGHTLFRLLIERHFDCLKVSVGDINAEIDKASPLATCEATTVCNAGRASSISSADLDKFMEVQCMALEKLKEAMEAPLQETVSFINAMYLQLD